MKLKVFLATVAFFLLIIVSEVIFNLRNNPEFQYWYNYYAGQAAIKASQPRLAFDYIGEIVDYKFQNGDTSVKRVLEIPSLSDNPNLKKDYASFLKSSDMERFFQTDLDGWAQNFYTLGFLAYKQDEPELAESFWQAAVDFAPDWSYFHIELANFYLSQGKKNAAETQLDACLELESPRSFCQWYIENHLENGTFENVGFLETKIQDEL